MGDSNSNSMLLQYVILFVMSERSRVSETKHMMKILFTDLDGTCIHYDENGVVKATSEYGSYLATGPFGVSSRVLLLPPSTTGAQVRKAESNERVGRLVHCHVHP